MTRALREGCVKMKITKLSISGAPATGKSSLADLLLGKPPCFVRDSTPLTAVPARAIQLSYLTSFTSEGDTSTMVWDCFDAGLIEGRVTALDLLRMYCQIAQGSAATLSGAASLSSQILGSLAEIIVEFFEFLTSPNLFETLHYIFLVDSGGQPAFQDIAPAFIRGNSVNIATLKLTECLNDCPQMAYTVQGRQICAPADLRLTNLQLIQTLFRSASSFSHHLPCTTNQGQSKPRCMIVGTFADRAHECTETIAEKNRQLRETLQHFEDIRIDNNQATGEIIIPINTLTQEGREEIASRLRRRIITPGTTIETEVPVKWFIFQFHLNVLAEMKGRSVFTMNECQETGRANEMNEEEVIDCLTYFHEQALLFHFREPLPDTIIIHAQPILNKVTELISISFPDTLAAFQELALVLPPNCHLRLKNHGLFNKQLLACLPEGFIENIFTADHLLKLLQYLLVIAQVPGEEREEDYFMPCVLPTKPVSDKLKAAFTKQADPLFLSWDQLPVPQGMFPALVVQLLQRKERPTFQLFKPSHCSSQQQFRNAIRLTCRGVSGGILLVDATYWIEVYYSGQTFDCSLIRQSVLNAVSNVVDKFNYQPELKSPQEGFLCQVCDSSPPSSHPCCITSSEGRLSVTCSADPVFTDLVISCRQLCWFDDMPGEF